MNKKILIVEDEEGIRQALVEKFKGENFSVFSAKDGKEGLKMAIEKHPDLILLDIVMPVMDGMTMLGELRKDEWGKNVNVIFLTNLSDAGKIVKTPDPAVLDYLVKSDWKINDLVEMVIGKLER